MKTSARKDSASERMKEVVSILMESAVYFDLSLRERFELVRFILNS